MNLDQLNETLLSHKSIIGGLNTNTALDIEKQDLSLQKEIINWFAKDGILKLHLYVASKSTEKSFVHFILEKGMIESNIGMAYLPPLRKPSSRKNNWISHLISRYYQ